MCGNPKSSSQAASNLSPGKRVIAPIANELATCTSISQPGSQPPYQHHHHRLWCFRLVAIIIISATATRLVISADNDKTMLRPGLHSSPPHPFNVRQVNRAPQRITHHPTHGDCGSGAVARCIRTGVCRSDPSPESTTRFLPFLHLRIDTLCETCTSEEKAGTASW
ncbi:uncharacterized protein CCOS01_09407 [Colletotrichum costaricense]|uniref:Uncharacterized protein n=1 Tax=Colletotrichum costaricense TaxID=1209916 RepID=A0AAI9YUA0_9PEZI|nr:uncharacterized protein CCOS01_09407 [Colletotrichum costaricense]KAK1524320.1 hypothetical protein CCOS01_09407 [Colletotrichum costaricense]